MHTFGGVGQIREVYLTVSVSSALSLLSTNLTSDLLTAVPATSSYPTPGPRMSTPLINTGQPLYVPIVDMTGRWPVPRC